jgi:hypothetical protein
LFLRPATAARCHGEGCSGWEVDEEAGSAAWRAELHGSGEGVDAVGVAGQPRAVRVGASDAVVSHSQGEELPALFYRDVHDGDVRVLRRIRQGPPTM